MEFKYKMVQVPRHIGVMQKQLRDVPESEVLARYVENVVNEQAKEGWEFYRADEMALSVSPGCLGSLLGAKETTMQYNVLTFRQGKA